MPKGQTKTQTQVNIKVKYDLDQASVNAVKKSLQDLQNIKPKDFSGTRKELDKVQQTARKVEQALTKAFNVNLGSLNTQAFNASLQQAGLNVDKIYTQFSKAGAQGQVAFSKMASSVLTTNMQLKETNSLVSRMGETMANTVKWGIASSVMNNFTNSVQQAFQYVKSLDSALNDIRIVTGQNTEQMAQFAVQANNAAQSLGRSTMDYTKAALTFYQQGLDESSVQARTESVLKAQNITGAGQEMADYLTAVWNGYKVANEEAELYVDKLAAVADSSASNMSQLAVAMSKVASTANALGVPVDSLNAQIATITATTRQAPETVGNALKTIYARINDIKTGADDAQISLGNYSSIMAELGFSVLDADGHLKDTGVTLEEIGQKWATLSREQQIYLARTMAGQRQYNNLIALFDNWSKYSDLVNVSMQAQGATAEKNAIYLESLGARLEQLGAAGERVKAALINEQDLKGLAEFGTGAVNLFGNLIQSIGGGRGAILNFGSIFTQVFSGTIAKEINNAIINFQNLHNNAEKINQDLANLEIFGASQGYRDETIKEIVDAKNVAKDYYDYMSAAQINQHNQLVKNIAVAKEDLMLINERKEAAQDFAESYVMSKTGKKQGFAGLNINEKILSEDFQEVSGTTLLTIQALQDKLNNFSIEKPVDSLKKLKDSYTELENQIGKTPITKLSNGYDKYQQALAAIKDTANPTQTQVRRVKRALDNLLQEANVTITDAGALKQIQAQAKDAENSLENSKKAANDYLQTTKQFADIKSFINIAAGLGQIASGINNIINLTKVWKNENLSAGEKILQTFTNLAMTVPLLLNSYTKIVKTLGLQIGPLGAILALEKKRTLEKERQLLLDERQRLYAADPLFGMYADEIQQIDKKIKGLDRDLLKQKDLLKNFGGTIKQTFSNIGSSIYSFVVSPIGQVTIGIGVAIAAIAIFVKAWNSIAESAKKAKENSEQLNKAYKDLKTSVDELNSSLESFYQGRSELAELRQGTEQWNKKLQQTNSQLSQIIEKYPQIAQYAHLADNGVLQLDSKGIEQFQQKQQQRLDAANLARLYGQNTANQAQAYSDITNLGRNIIGLNRDDIQKVVNAVQSYGDAVLDDSKSLQQLTGLNEKQIKVVEENKQAIRTVTTQISNNTAASKLLSQSILEDNLKDNTSYQNAQKQGLGDTYRNLIDRQIQSRNVDNLSVDEDIAKRYEEITGQSVKTNYFLNTYKVWDETQKKYVKLNRQIVDSTVNAANAMEDLPSIINQVNQKVNQTRRIVGEEGVKAALELSKGGQANFQALSAKQVQKISQLNDNEIQKIIDLYGLTDTPQQIRTKLSTSLQTIRQNTRAYISQLPFGVQEAFKELNTDKLSAETQQQIGNLLKKALVLGKGKEGIEQQIATIFDDAIDSGKIEELLNKDFSNLELNDVKNIFTELGLSTDYSSEALQHFIAVMTDLAKEQPKSAQDIYNDVHSVIDKKSGKTLEYNDQIDQEAYKKLAQAGVQVDSAFVKLTSGMYKFVGDAEEFYKQANQTSLKPFIDQINELRNKIANPPSYDELSQQTYQYNRHTGQVVNVNYDLVQKQVDTLDQFNLISQDDIARYNDLIQARRLDKDTLDQIHNIIEANIKSENDYINLAKEELHTKELTLAYSQQDLGEFFSQRNEGTFDTLSIEQYTGALLAAADAEGINIDNVKALSSLFQEQADGLDWVNNELKGHADEATQVATRLEDLISGVQNIQKVWKESLKQGLQNGDLTQGLAATKEAISDMFNIEIPQSFVQSQIQLGNIQRIAEGDLTALNDLSIALFDLMAHQVFNNNLQVGIVLNEDQFNNDLLNLETDLAEINPTLEVGAYIQDQDYYNALNQMINKTATTKEDVQKILSGLQYEPNVEPYEVPITNHQFNEDSKTYTFQYQDPITGELYSKTVDEDLGSQYLQSGSITLFSIKGSKFSGGSSNIRRAGGSRTVPKAPSSGSKKGKSGGSTKKPAAAKKYENKVTPQESQFVNDPYQQQNKHIEKQSEIIKQLQRDQKKLTGEKRRENLEKQADALEKQAQYYQDLLDAEKDASRENSFAWYREQLQKAYGNIFDQDGQIADKNALKKRLGDEFEAAERASADAFQKLQNEATDWEEKVWGTATAAQQQVLKAQRERREQEVKDAKAAYDNEQKQRKENYDKALKLIDNYDKAYKDHIEYEKALQESLNQAYQQRIAASKIRVDFAIDTGDLERQWLDFENKVIKKLSKDDILGNVKADFKQLTSYFDSGQINKTLDQINTIRKQINIMQQGGTSSIYGDRISDARADLEQYLKKSMQQFSNIQDLVDGFKEAYLDVLDDAKKKLDEQIDQYERVNKIIDHNVKLTQLLYGDKAYDTLNKYYEMQKKNNEQELQSLKAQQDYWQSMLDNEVVGSDSWKKIKEHLDDITDDLNSKLEQMIENLSTQFENNINGIIDRLNNALTGGRGLQYLDDQWDMINNYDDQFLDPVESKMGIEQITRIYQQAFDDAAGNPKAQQKINGLMNDQLKILKEKDHLTEYDLERAKTSLEVEKARMALEDSRYSKTKMRLRRDSQGNYTYQYVADEQKLGDLQSALADAQANLYNMDKEHYKENLNNLYDAYKDYIEQMKKLTMEYNATQDKEERDRIEARMKLLKESSSELMKALTEDNNVTLGTYLTSSTLSALGLDASQFSSEQMLEIVNKTVPQASSNIQDLANSIVHEGGLLPATDEYFKEINEQVEKFDQNVNTVLTEAGTSLEVVSGEKLDQNITKARELVISNQDLLASTVAETEAMQTMLNTIDQYLDRVQQLEDALPTLRDAYNLAQLGKGSNLTADEIAATDNNLDTTNGMNFTGDIATDTTTLKNQVNALMAQFEKFILGISGVSMSTGGYTGDWGETSGRLAFLHQKELVLNEQDTLNILAAVNAVREITNSLNSINNGQLSSIAQQAMGFSSGINTNSQLDQNVHIEATFPNVREHTEIEQAFNNLVNMASMRASGYRD